VDLTRVRQAHQPVQPVHLALALTLKEALLVRLVCPASFLLKVAHVQLALRVTHKRLRQVLLVLLAVWVNIKTVQGVQLVTRVLLAR
jgi:hypothetical protein